ncbi:MAG: antirestriction protein [Bifidobacterium adolescentis]
MTNHTTIYREILADDQRTNHTAKLFGIQFPMLLEPTIYAMTDRLSADYTGGFWDLFTLSNGAFYMAPRDHPFVVASMNGFEGSMSADALGITACLFAYSQLSFGGDTLAEVCAAQYHLLREFAIDHAEVRAIMAATD